MISRLTICLKRTAVIVLLMLLATTARADVPPSVLTQVGFVAEAGTLFAICRDQEGISSQEYLDWARLENNVALLIEQVGKDFGDDTMFVAYHTSLFLAISDPEIVQELLDHRKCDRKTLAAGKQWISDAQAWFEQVKQ